MSIFLECPLSQLVLSGFSFVCVLRRAIPFSLLTGWRVYVPLRMELIAND